MSKYYIYINYTSSGFKASSPIVGLNFDTFESYPSVSNTRIWPGKHDLTNNSFDAWYII